MPADPERDPSTGRMACTQEGNSPAASESALLDVRGPSTGVDSAALESQSGVSLNSELSPMLSNEFSVKAGAGTSCAGSISLANGEAGCDPSTDLNVDNQSGVAEEKV